MPGMEPPGRMLKGVAIYVSELEQLSYAVLDGMTSGALAALINPTVEPLRRKRRTNGVKCCVFTTLRTIGRIAVL